MGNRYEFITPCHFRLEAVCKRDIADLGYEIVYVEDGNVTFSGDMEALVRANIFLRTTQRILLKVAEFKAVTFEELFQNVKKVPWEEYFPSDARFWVTKATSVKSKLFSPSDIQSIVKKAMVERMKEHYHINWFEEDGETETYKIVTTMRQDSLKGLISGESPLGKALLGHKVGDRIFVEIGGGDGYYVVIRSIDKSAGDDDALRSF